MVHVPSHVADAPRGARASAGARPRSLGRHAYMQHDAQKNASFLQAMKETIAQPIQELAAVSKSQVEFFTTQNQALQNLLQSKPSPQHIPQSSPHVSTNLDFATSNSAPAANSTNPELGKNLENLNQFIASTPSINEDKENLWYHSNSWIC